MSQREESNLQPDVYKTTALSSWATLAFFQVLRVGVEPTNLSVTSFKPVVYTSSTTQASSAQSENRTHITFRSIDFESIAYTKFRHLGISVQGEIRTLTAIIASKV